MERYAVTTNKESGIVNDPNDWAREHNRLRCIFNLVLSAISLNTRTVEIVNTLFDQFKKGVVLDLVIIQFKATDSFKEDAIMKWKTTCSNLLDMTKMSDSFRARYNEKVRLSFDLFKKTHINLVRRNPKLNVRFFYVFKGNEIHSNVQEQADDMSILPYLEIKDAIKAIK